MYGVFGMIAFVCWVVENAMCSRVAALPINPQLHAWWHTCMAINTYCGPMFGMFPLLARTGFSWLPQFCLPYVSYLLDTHTHGDFVTALCSGLCLTTRTATPRCLSRVGSWSLLAHFLCTHALPRY